MCSPFGQRLMSPAESGRDGATAHSPKTRPASKTTLTRGPSSRREGGGRVINRVCRKDETHQSLLWIATCYSHRNLSQEVEKTTTTQQRAVCRSPDGHPMMEPCNGREQGQRVGARQAPTGVGIPSAPWASIWPQRLCPQNQGRPQGGAPHVKWPRVELLCKILREQKPQNSNPEIMVNKAKGLSKYTQIHM